ncbi:hypothetical protein ES703_94082 [subsurface metagenome]
MFQERNQGSTYRDHLLGGYLHIIYLFLGDSNNFSPVSGYQFRFDKPAFLIYSIGASNIVIIFLSGIEIYYFLSSPTSFYFPIRGFQKTKLIYSNIGG